MPAQHDTYGIAPERIPLPKDELLHTLRGLQEADHFQKFFKFCAFNGWPCFPFHQAIEVGKLSSAADKYSPVMQLLLAELLRYTYQRWFRPYRSEVDRGQFLTKVNMVPEGPLPSKTCSQEMVDCVRLWSTNLCDRVADTKARELGVDEEHAGKCQYFMPPPFGAVAVAVRASDYTVENHDISILTVLVVRTGVEESLSEPIDLDWIPVSDRLDSVVDQSGVVSVVETKLDTAISFLMALEQREAAASCAGVESAKTLVYMTSWWVDPAAGAAEDLGWDNDTMGFLQGPSSAWVDEEKYPSWSGQGYESSVHYQQNCQRYRAGAERWVARE